jgi:hypothetical protein
MTSRMSPPGPSRDATECPSWGEAEITPLRLFPEDATCVLDPQFRRRSWSVTAEQVRRMAAFGRQERQDSAGMRLVTAASRCRSSTRRSITLIVRHAGQRTQRNQYRAATAAPIVGDLRRLKPMADGRRTDASVNVRRTLCYRG